MKKRLLILVTINFVSLISVVQLPQFQPKPVLELVKKYLPDNPFIVDAGAYEGHESVLMAQLWPKGCVFSFEPVPEIFNILIRVTDKYSNIKRFPIALSSSNGSAKFYLSEEPEIPNIPSQSGSLRPPKEHLNYSGTCFKRQISVPTITFDRWAEQNEIEKIDFLWLDMQGTELDMLKASPKILKTVKAIFTEVEFVEAYEGQALYKEIKSWLESEGFTMIAKDFGNPLDRNNGGSVTWFGNALFVRKELIN